MTTADPDAASPPPAPSRSSYTHQHIYSSGDVSKLELRAHAELPHLAHRQPGSALCLTGGSTRAFAASLGVQRGLELLARGWERTAERSEAKKEKRALKKREREEKATNESGRGVVLSSLFASFGRTGTGVADHSEGEDDPQQEDGSKNPYRPKFQFAVSGAAWFTALYFYAVRRTKHPSRRKKQKNQKRASAGASAGATTGGAMASSGVSVEDRGGINSSARSNGSPDGGASEPLLRAEELQLEEGGSSEEDDDVFDETNDFLSEDPEELFEDAEEFDDEDELDGVFRARQSFSVYEYSETSDTDEEKEGPKPKEGRGRRYCWGTTQRRGCSFLLQFDVAMAQRLSVL